MRGGGVQYYTTEKSHSMVPLSVLIPCASFPKSFKWAGNKLDITNRIGNSVPPLLMKAVAEHIKKAILMPLSRARIASGTSETAVPCLAKAGA